MTCQSKEFLFQSCGVDEAHGGAVNESAVPGYWLVSDGKRDKDHRDILSFSAMFLLIDRISPCGL